MIYLPIVQNIALLVSLSLINGLLARDPRRQGTGAAVLSGLIFGVATVVGMLVPVKWMPGVIFDGRSIVLGVAGLFGGPVVGGVAALVAVAYRIALGGAGALMGVSVTLEAVLFGIAWHGLRQRRPGAVGALPLLGLGALIHVVMVLMMGLLPGGLSGDALRAMALPVLLLYPAGFMLVARLFLVLESRLATEEALRASETRNRALLDAMPDMMFLFSAEGRILDFRARTHDELYVPPGAFLDRLVEDVLPAPVARLTRDKLREVEAGGATVMYEYSLEIGTVHDFECRLAPCGPGEFLAIVRNITDRKRAERTLRDSQALYEDLVNTVMVGFYRLREVSGPELEGGVPGLATEYMNDRYCELVGMSREEVLADVWAVTRHVHPDDLASWTAANRATATQGTPFSWEGRLVVDGKDRWLHFESRRRVLESGERVWVGAVLDISDRMRVAAERRAMERQMLHVQKLESLGVLAGGMAHDFNNILMAILANADLALARLPAMSPVRNNLEAIESAARRASDLSCQMLAYSGRGKFVIEPIQLSDLVSEMVHLLQASISKKALLNLNLAKDLPNIEGDATQIRQILMNLITNASEALGQGSGVITISTGSRYCGRDYLAPIALDMEIREGPYVSLEVSDTGCGMDRETLAKIFEPFFTTKFTGRGLGMAAVLGIVKGHHGAIRVYSEVGKGTTFRLLFPARDPAREAAEPAAAPAPGLWRGAGKVLLVDDEETLLAVGAEMLRALGFEVLTAANGREALAAYAAHPGEIAFVLLDLTMPDMDGEETFRELRKVDPQVRVVLTSGYTEQDVAARFAGRGLAAFIQKPFNLKDLAGRLQGVLEGQAGTV